MLFPDTQHPLISEIKKFRILQCGIFLHLRNDSRREAGAQSAPQHSAEIGDLGSRATLCAGPFVASCYDCLTRATRALCWSIKQAKTPHLHRSLNLARRLLPNTGSKRTGSGCAGYNRLAGTGGGLRDRLRWAQAFCTCSKLPRKVSFSERFKRALVKSVATTGFQTIPDHFHGAAGRDHLSSGGS